MGLAAPSLCPFEYSLDGPYHGAVYPALEKAEPPVSPRAGRYKSVTSKTFFEKRQKKSRGVAKESRIKHLASGVDVDSHGSVAILLDARCEPAWVAQRQDR
jgi:hypothetical protein